MGGKIDHSINSRGGGPYSFVLSGQNHHLIGSLLPPPGNPPVYAQLYIYDTDNEVSNRISSVRFVLVIFFYILPNGLYIITPHDKPLFVNFTAVMLMLRF